MNTETIKFLTVLKNGSSVYHESVKTNSNKLIQSLIQMLYREGFILSFRSKEKFINDTISLYIQLRHCDSKAVFRNLKIVSTPSRKIHLGIRSICRMRTRKNLWVFSTTEGLLTLDECKRLRIGGVLLFIC